METLSIRADFPAPLGPIIRSFKVGRDSSDAILKFYAFGLVNQIVDGSIYKEIVRTRQGMIHDVTLASLTGKPQGSLQQPTFTCSTNSWNSSTGFL